MREFQRVFNLDTDGIVGKATWYKIKEVWTGVKQLSELASEGLTLMEVQPTFPEVLRYGDEGVAVSTLQYYLAFLGYFLPEQPPAYSTTIPVTRCIPSRAITVFPWMVSWGGIPGTGC